MAVSELECVLDTGREVRRVMVDGRWTYEVQPARDNYWIATTDRDRAIRIGNDRMTAADREWLRHQ